MLQQMLAGNRHPGAVPSKTLEGDGEGRRDLLLRRRRIAGRATFQKLHELRAALPTTVSRDPSACDPQLPKALGGLT